jgi:hypothetical protein
MVRTHNRAPNLKLYLTSCLLWGTKRLPDLFSSRKTNGISPQPGVVGTVPSEMVPLWWFLLFIRMLVQVTFKWGTFRYYSRPAAAMMG